MRSRITCFATRARVRGSSATVDREIAAGRSRAIASRTVEVEMAETAAEAERRGVPYSIVVAERGSGEAPQDERLRHALPPLPSVTCAGSAWA